MKELNVALFGYGYVGKTFHAPLINSVPGMTVSTVVSSDAAKVHAELPEVRVVHHHADALADNEIDLVVIATPNDSHFALAKRALEAGKHVVIDKPFTTTAAEANTLIALANRHSRVLSAFHNRRWDADFLTVKALIESGQLGEIMHFESHFDRFRPEVIQRWRETAEHGGLWYDLGPHLVDQTLQLFGAPRAISADMARQREGAQQVDYFHVVLRYERLRVILHASALVPGGSPRFLIHGSRASFRKVGMDTQEASLKRGDWPGSAGWGVDTSPGVVLRPAGDKIEEHRITGVPGDYRRYYEGVRDAVLGLGADPVPASDAAMVMRIIELGLAARHGQEQVL